jgi:hypothetical protein
MNDQKESTVTDIASAKLARHNSTDARPNTRSWALLAGIFSTTSALAAGGHHALDDAVILEPGNCQVESWFTRSDDRERMLHVGSGCRVGPVELGVAAEHARQTGASETGYGLQVKWATELVPGFNAGLSLSTDWQSHVRPRHQGSTVAGLLSWFPREDVALHLNLGRDFARAGADQDRSGVSVEWTAGPGWSVTAERYLEEQTHFVRAGLRWALSEAWSFDLSRAHRLRGPGESNWTFGTTWQFPHP